MQPNFLPSNLRRYYNKIKKIMTLEPSEYCVRGLGYSEIEDIDLVLQGEYKKKYLDEYYNYFSGYDRNNIFEKMLYFYQHPCMTEVLNTEAKYAFRWGFHNLYPFLDEELISYANHTSLLNTELKD